VTFISLFSDEHGFVATDQRLFSPEELSSVNQVIEQAQRLEQQLATHHQKVEAAETSAAEKGYLLGIEKGKSAAAEQLAVAIKNLQEVQQQELEEVKANCAELAIEIVRKIAGNSEPLTWMQAQVEEAVQELVDEPVLKLRVATEQAEPLRLRLASSNQQAIQTVIADETLEPNACVLVTAGGQIDIGLDTQLDAILAIFGQPEPLDDVQIESDSVVAS